MALNKNTINTTFEAFTSQTVLIVGDVMIDSYLWGKVTRVSPEAPVPVVSVNKRESRLGGAANVAINIKALGATPILCSVIGNDEKGRLFTQLLKEEQISNEGIVHSRHEITTVKTRVLSRNQQMIRVDEEDDAPLQQEDNELLVEKFKSVLENNQVDVIIFQDYDKGVLNEASINAMLSTANSKGIPTAVDPKKRNFLAYSGCTLFKPNLKELQDGLNLPVNPEKEDSLSNAIQELRAKIKVQSVMVTLSKFGVCIDHNNQLKFIAAHQRDISDVSGAGDTVISVASLCLGLNLPAPEMCELANLAGGQVCEWAGVVPVNKEQLKTEATKLFA